MYSSGCGILYGEDRGKLKDGGGVDCLCGGDFGVEIGRENNYYSFGMLQTALMFKGNYCTLLVDKSKLCQSALW